MAAEGSFQEPKRKNLKRKMDVDVRAFLLLTCHFCFGIGVFGKVSSFGVLNSWLPVPY